MRGCLPQLPLVDLLTNAGHSGTPDVDRASIVLVSLWPAYLHIRLELVAELMSEVELEGGLP